MSSSAGVPSGIDASERTRRIQAIVHTALFAGVGIYAVLLIFLRTEIAGSASARPPGSQLFLVLAGLGVAQYAVASVVGRAMLRARRSRPLDRVRLSFLLRGAAAEAIALYGLVLGFVGGRASHAAALLALAVVALIACFPGKGAWEEALLRAES
jgi:hypothetical protein